MAVKDWSTSAASNTSVGGINIAEGCPRANVNDGMRAIMAEARARFDEIPSVKDSGALGDGDANDTVAFHAAMAASSHVFVPAGTYIVENLVVPSGVTLSGAGKSTILKLPALSILRVFLMTGRDDWTIENLTMDARTTGTSIALFTTCSRGTVRHVWATGSAGHGIEFDNCGRCLAEDIDFYDTGGDSSDAALYFKNATGDGSFNKARNIASRTIQGRLLYNLGNDYTQINGLNGQMTNAEVLLLEESSACKAENIIMVGNEPASGALSDGIALNGNCFYNSISDFHVSANSGHGISINGQTGKTGASYNTISNGTIVNADEGGVVITDQGVVGSIPVGNVVSNVVVENAGKQIASEAFGVSGGTDNQFKNCTAVDSQGSPTTTYGFREANGANTAARNAFSGRLIGTFATATSLRAATTTVIENTGQRMVGTATYDPANLADGAGVTTTVTVTGATLGMVAEASFSNDLQGIQLTAWVSASNTVSVRFQNETGGAIDLASGTITAAARSL